MNNYIVQNICEDLVAYNEWFIVRAKSKKEALDKVYTDYMCEYKRTDFKAYSLDEFYGEDDVAVIY